MSHPPHVLIADDDDDVRDWIASTLAAAGFDISSVASASEALARMQATRHRLDLLVLDLEMPGGGALAVLERARVRLDPATVPTIVVSGHGDVERRVAAFEAGAVDFVAKPLDGRELIARVRSHLRVSTLAVQWRDGADRDPLTGLYNRRGLLGRLGHAVDHALATGAPLAVMFVDLDRFKEVNDRHGHVAGDRLLRRVAAALADGSTRAGGVVGRWGGDEFVVALPAADDARVEDLAAELRAALARHLGPSPISASLGVSWLRPHASRPPPDHAPLALIEAADRAMYIAKLGRVCEQAPPARRGTDHPGR